MSLLQIVVPGLLVAAIVLAVMLRFTSFRHSSRVILFGALGGYVGFCTAAFTSVGIPFVLYWFHIWQFPGDDQRTSLVMFALTIAVLFVVPIAGLIGGVVFGASLYRRLKGPPV